MEVINLKKSILSFPVMFQKVGTEFMAEDARFTKVKVWLMHLGQNFNGGIFEKSVVDTALSTLDYIPIVGFIEDNSAGEKDFSDHRYIITKKDNQGSIRKYIGNAYGVIKSTFDNNAHYEKRICDDGVERTFLVVDGLMWNMFDDSSDIINRDLTKSHSMELWDDDDSIDGYEDEDNIFHFTKFSFRAACILGQDQEPGMINSTIEVQFTLADFVKNIQNELSNKLIEFTKTIDKQGGNNNMPKTDFSLTATEQFENISQIVSQQDTIKNYWGDDVPRYYLRDIQDNEVIVVDRGKNYNTYGFSFTANGDNTEIDFESGKRKKLRYDDFVEGAVELEGAFNFDKHIKDFEESVTKKIAAVVDEKMSVESNYSKVKKEFDEIKPLYEKLSAAENARAEEKVSEQKEVLFLKFDAHLSDVADYVEIKEKSNELSIEEINEQCALLYVKKTLDIKTDFLKSKNEDALDIPNPHTEDGDFIKTKYGYIPVNH